MKNSIKKIFLLPLVLMLLVHSTEAFGFVVLPVTAEHTSYDGYVEACISSNESSTNKETVCTSAANQYFAPESQNEAPEQVSTASDITVSKN